MTETKIASRCRLFVASTEYQANPRIEYYRESIRDLGDGSGDVIRKPVPLIQRMLSDIAATPVPGGPRLCSTAADVYALVADFGHLFAAEDDAARAAQTTTTTP